MITFKIDFEDYLADKHAEQYCGLDDEMCEDFEEWIGDLDNQELIDYAQDYAQLVKTRTEAERDSDNLSPNKIDMCCHLDSYLESLQ